MSPILAVPKDKFAELTQEVNNLQTSGRINEFAIAKFRREAQKLKEKVPSEGLSLLGMIACIEGEYGKMRKLHEGAIENAPGDPLYLSHYASSLERAGYLEEACEYACKAYDEDPANEIALEILVDCSDMLDREEEYLFYLGKLKKLKGDDFTKEKISFPEDDPKLLTKMLCCLKKELEQKDMFVPMSDAKFDKMFELANEIEALS
ncbi:MAG: hypothetical protein WCR47_07575 [Desulfoplanes sp.]